LAWLAKAMAENNAAARERAELARLQALYELARNDPAAAQARIATMQEFAATLPRRARFEAVRADLTAARVALARGDRAAASAALDHAATAERESLGDQPVPGASAWRGDIYLLRASVDRLANAPESARANARKALEQFAPTLPADHPWRREAELLADAG
jgi:hypothetical protein